MSAHRKWTDEDLIRLAPEVFSMAELMRRLGLNFSGDQYPRLRGHCERLGLDLSHFFQSGGAAHAISDEEWCKKWLIKGTNKLKGYLLRKRVVGSGLLVDACARCGITEWMGEPAPLQMEHINGDPTDNRIENLTILCPNCHCLTPTWGRKKRRSPVV